MGLGVCNRAGKDGLAFAGCSFVYKSLVTPTLLDSRLKGYCLEFRAYSLGQLRIESLHTYAKTNIIPLSCPPTCKVSYGQFVILLYLLGLE